MKNQKQKPVREALFLLAPLLAAMTFNSDSLGTAPSSLGVGRNLVSTAEYRFPAEDDPIVLSTGKTEVWARTFWPTGLNSRAPLILMLHGNHGTCGIGQNPREDKSCEYTQSGTCPAGYVVTPNHEGYDYLGRQLASRGFFVVSINANRGITCGNGIDGDEGLNLARGKLVMKHLKLLSLWTQQGGAPASLGLGADGLIGKVDLDRIGLFGHSRGGEGMRAALYYHTHPSELPQYAVPGAKIRAIFEIGAVDGQTGKVLDAGGVIWNQLLPMCDGDVSDLEGRYPFLRMLQNRSENPYAQKSLYFVWGANHNYFNTEWQTSDSDGCLNHSPIFNPSLSGSPQQQLIALSSVPAFFMVALKGDEKNFNQNFNPLFDLPEPVVETTRIEREMTPSPGESQASIFEDFDQPTGTNTHHFPNQARGVSIEHVTVDHLSRFPVIEKAAAISWSAPGGDVYFQTNWAAPGSGQEISSFATLDFRVTRKINVGDPSVSTAFSVVLVDSSERVSNKLSTDDFVKVVGPGNQEVTFQTVRIPIKQFTGIDLKSIHGVRFVFDRSEAGAILLANVRLNHSLGEGSAPRERRGPSKGREWILSQLSQHAPFWVPPQESRIVGVRSVPRSPALRGRPGMEIEVQSKIPFPVRDELPILKIGNHETALSRYSGSGLDTLIFTMSLPQFRSLQNGEGAQVFYGKAPDRIWLLGVFTSTK